MTTEELILKVGELRSLMADVATGGSRIDDVNETYQQARVLIASELAKRGVADPNPYQDLWQWYSKWKADFPKYHQRRDYLASLFQPLIDQLMRPGGERATVLEEKPTGWDRVDRAVDKVRYQLPAAQEEEDFQQVGLLSREILISLAQAVFDPSVHKSLDGKDPSSTDAKRMLEAYIEQELRGGSNEAARRHAKAALGLANELQHKRTADYRLAALCAEATTSVVNIVAVLSGRHVQGASVGVAGQSPTASQQRVIDKLGNLIDQQREVLHSCYKLASDESGSRIFAWTSTGGGLCMMDIYLIFLLDEQAVTLIREESQRPNEETRWYRFKEWLYDYLTDHPEVFEPASPTAT